jgi:membrane fusion protein (multidrug efflux system)
MADNAQPAPNRPRRLALAGVTTAVLLAAVAATAWWWLALRKVESTDNAYVQATTAQLTPQQAGTVVAVLADDMQAVRAGQVLVRLDPADAQVALEQARSQLALTEREVRTLYANGAGLQAQVAVREAELQRAHAQAAVAQMQLQVAAAQAARQAAQAQVLANQALTQGVRPEQHPSVQRAAAQVREAELALQRCELAAPMAGVVARRAVQPGQRVAAGAPLMAVVALQATWVEANFKESQLGRIRVGQPVVLTADIYGRELQFKGTVDGLGAGTGAAFAVLPAQNATGNWIKVVQRLPVRIALDARELAANPLRVGLSMQVRVDVSHPGTR